MRASFSIVALTTAALFALLTACSDDAGSLALEDPDASEPTTERDAGEEPEDAGDDADARGPFDPEDEPVTCTESPCATQLVAGSEHFCARMSDGTVRCWGGDAFGALGRGEDTPSGPGPAPVVGLEGVMQLSAAGATTCARLDDGTVMCWGDNRHALLGLSADPPLADEDPHPTPERVALDAPAVRVDVGHGSACALLETGRLSCWGKDDQRQLGRGEGDDLDWLNPVRGPGVAELGGLAFTRTAAGSFSVFGLDSAGDLFSWGAVAGDEGVISGRVASVSPAPVPLRIASLSKVTSFAATVSIQPPWEPPGPFDPPPFGGPPKPRAHACAIAAGEVYCWGRSYTGALCTGFPDPEQRPRRAPFDANTWPQQLAVGDEITCARTTDGSVYCCGSDIRGRLGTGREGILSATFTKATAFTGHAVQVATSSRTVCALVQGGSVECWGGNDTGELGRDPDDAPHPSPSKIAF